MFLEYTSLIIPTKDRPKSLKNLIESIEGLISKLNEIIIIDSSNKENLEFTKKFVSKFKNVKLIKSAPSISEQRNLGIENCNMENKFLMFCDDDIIFEKDSINIMNDFKTYLSTAPVLLTFWMTFTAGFIIEINRFFPDCLAAYF